MVSVDVLDIPCYTLPNHSLKARQMRLLATIRQLGQFNDSMCQQIIVTLSFEQLEDVAMFELTQCKIEDTLRDHVQWHFGRNLG